MDYWNKVPLFRLIIPFILGILSSIFLQIPNFQILTFIVFIFLFIVFFIKKYTFRWVFGFVSYLLFFLFGVIIIQSKHYVEKENYFNNYNSEYFEVQLLEDVVTKPNSLKAEVKVLSVFSKENKIKTSGKSIIYFEVDSFSSKLKYGDVILINSGWEQVMGPTNPAQFNYKLFLRNKGIFHQCYLTKDKWKKTNRNEGFVIKRKSLYFREIAKDILVRNGFRDEVLSVSSALLLGDKNLLDRETVLVYSSSGAMHVLAVSGLHVGIIFLAFSYFLFFLDRIKYGPYLKAIILILILWSYALFTGMSASVLRASTMFSFVIIGGMLKRKTNIYNTLAASAIFLLIIDPLIIMQVGFQLSYIAVIGIVYLQPKIYKLFYFNNWFLDKIWIISSVSIAAQIATFPLGMYYFHQYPNYFLLSNLFVIPLATIILNLSLLMFVTTFFSLVSEFISQIINYLVSLLNSLVRWVDQLPYSLNLGIDISFSETLIIYVSLIILIPSIVNKRFRNIQLSIIILIVFMILQITEMSSIFNQKKIVFYDVPKGTAIDFIDGTNCYFIATDWLPKDKSKMRFNILHNRWEINIENVERIIDNFQSDNIKKAEGLLQFYNKKLFILKDENYTKSELKKRYDILIIEGGSEENFNKFIKNNDVEKVIITTLTTNNQRYKIKEMCKENDINFHDIKVDGSFQINLN
ncbi:MAG: DUF4131 domain-containing protein [Flavobacteriales bacterium]|nr:DUF4131 domain-containing protein [Flavobacteriales bacterium]